MPSIRIFNTTPSGKIRNDVPAGRASSFQTGRAGEKGNIISPGMLIGMLGLTYAVGSVTSLLNFSERPNVRILNT